MCYEDWSSDPQNIHKKLGVVAHKKIPAVVRQEAETKIGGYLGAHGPASLAYMVRPSQ